MVLEVERGDLETHSMEHVFKNYFVHFDKITPNLRRLISDYTRRKPLAARHFP